MEVDLYDYRFDPALVAQEPAAERSASRLMVLDRQRPAVSHHRFAELPELVRGDELFVVNDTRVIPARLFARKPSGGRVELLLVQPLPGDGQRWWAMSRANKPLRPSQRLQVGDEELEIGGRAAEPGLIEVRFRPELDLTAFLEQHGSVPLPPYIERPPGPEDARRYQTIFAAHPGAVAAPTAGLHFTPELLDRLQRRGVELARLTLHVGPGTFRPITTPDLAGHRMHHERFTIPEQTAAAVARAKAQQRPVVAVGTTAVRALEAAALATGGVGSPGVGLPRPGPGETDLFIRPGHDFRVVDSLVTNFHWPRSTLLVLVAALAGRERVLAAYHEAVALRYRLFSYGDAMWIR